MGISSRNIGCRCCHGCLVNQPGVLRRRDHTVNSLSYRFWPTVNQWISSVHLCLLDMVLYFTQGIQTYKWINSVYIYIYTCLFDWSISNVNEHPNFDQPAELQLIHHDWTSTSHTVKWYETWVQGAFSSINYDNLRYCLKPKLTTINQA